MERRDEKVVGDECPPESSEQSGAETAVPGGYHDSSDEKQERGLQLEQGPEGKPADEREEDRCESKRVGSRGRMRPQYGLFDPYCRVSHDCGESLSLTVDGGHKG